MAELTDDDKQLLALLHAKEVRVGVLGLERFKLRPVANHHLRPGQVCIKKRCDVLLDRHAADIQPDRLLHARERPAIILALRRMEKVGVHATRAGLR